MEAGLDQDTGGWGEVQLREHGETGVTDGERSIVQGVIEIGGVERGGMEGSDFPESVTIFGRFNEPMTGREHDGDRCGLGESAGGLDTAFAIDHQVQCRSVQALGGRELERGGIFDQPMIGDTGGSRNVRDH